MAQGHMIPMIDMARLFAERGVLVSLVTTPHNASRFESVIARARDSSLPIKLVEIKFPSEEVGLPIGYENLDSLPSRSLLGKFFNALNMLQQPLEEYLVQQTPSPTCIISDKSLFWTSDIAKKFGIPRIVFHGMCCFSLLATHNIKLHNSHRSVALDSEPFTIPGLAQEIQITRAQLPGAFVVQPDLDHFRDKMGDAESDSFGVVVNSFDGIEEGSHDLLSKALNKRVWCIGPVSLCNKEDLDKVERGNIASIGRSQCLEWLDRMEPNSVVYACLGSQCRLVTAQLVELGLGLEASGRPFIWVIKKEEKNFEEFEDWLLKDKFEERIMGKGLLIKGWAPQMLILAHQAVGAFLTHCGWNSTIEGVCSGLPLITWPLFAEQFLNEKLIVEVLRIGVRVGVEMPVRWGDEEKVGVLVKREDVRSAIDIVMMDGGDQGTWQRARELGEMARAATQEGGSSHLNISYLIEDLIKQVKG